MAQVETTIDSIRVAAISPERTIILRQKRVAESYLPFCVTLTKLACASPLPPVNHTENRPGGDDCFRVTNQTPPGAAE